MNDHYKTPKPSNSGLPQSREQKLLEMLKVADHALKHNLYVTTLNEKTYRRTVPSKEFYVHQWNWDSAAVAMGLVHLNPERAYDELRALVSGKWDNGLIAHITYNPGETRYYPQAGKWHTEQFRRGEIVTSGITQPPLLSIAVDYVYKHSPDGAAGDFLDEVLPAVMKYHDYLKRYRDPEDGGLLTIVHPWESGTDNSPRWDSSYTHINLTDVPQAVREDVDANRTDDKLGKASHRPTQEDYYRFMGLVALFAKLGWDYEKIVAQSPFAVKDILFSSLWARANEALADTLTRVGRTDEAAKYHKWAQQTQEALAHTWDEEHQQYCDIDVAQGRREPIIEPTNAMFLPLLAGAVTDEQLPKVLTRLSDPEQFWPAYPVPSTALNSPKFELTRYWRGPTWPITNLLIIEGLMRYAPQSAQARQMGEELVDRTLDMIAKNGFYEYYDPTKGEARPGREDDARQFGFATFSWPAAIFIQLAEQYRKAR
ncbi:hypothetical protein KSD_56350 [Ktedonobacter sp. SOSP1-85]|uniref:amylo-alpha-1,6-glucosidase n=1 Tax=Ktedonobacter sp. SOSP1-85 TaxID=2778367 RepID=UPI001915B079|nr:trehalase family glycosidase [Ktedonobacter sp. SOSP1-85]GHO77864.1 hypothetical protein KSD_56350 [Ktedonobacter sp. SOSP1-85]